MSLGGALGDNGRFEVAAVVNDLPPASAPPNSIGGSPIWLETLHPLDAYVLVVAFACLVIAAAQWLASNYTDRRALRLFAVRNALAAAGWIFGSPLRHSGHVGVPMIPVVVAALLLGLTVWALDEFLGQSTPRRRAWIALGMTLAVLLVWAGTLVAPQDTRGIYLVMGASMALCAVMAWRAAQRERGVGHRIVALSFLSYPVVIAGAWLSRPGLAGIGLAYLIALPNLLVGVTVLVVSLIRAGRRAQDALRERARAEQALIELNTTLEHRVQQRTGELQLMVDGLHSFTRNVSHDLRGPLAGLAGVARLAEQALDAGDLDQARRLLEVIAPQSDRLQSLVEDLLTLSRVADAPLARVAQPLAPLVREALAQLALAPDSARDLARVQVQIDELPSAAVDAPMLRQVYVNLLGNALRFSAAAADVAARAGGALPKVRVGWRAAGERTELFVTDSGAGFPPEAAARLFQPFSLLHGSGLSRNGIGLSIVRRVIERHGGRVWAESRPGAGATFWFSLDPAG